MCVGTIRAQYWVSMELHGACLSISLVLKISRVFQEGNRSNEYLVTNWGVITLMVFGFILTSPLLSLLWDWNSVKCPGLGFVGGRTSRPPVSFISGILKEQPHLRDLD